LDQEVRLSTIGVRLYSSDSVFRGGKVTRLTGIEKVKGIVKDIRIVHLGVTTIDNIGIADQ